MRINISIKNMASSSATVSSSHCATVLSNEVDFKLIYLLPQLLWALISLTLLAQMDGSLMKLNRDLRIRRSSENTIQDSEPEVDPSLPSYVIGKGPSFHPAEVTIRPLTKYTATGQFSVFSPPFGDFFPFGGRFFFPKD